MSIYSAKRNSKLVSGKPDYPILSHAAITQTMRMRMGMMQVCCCR